MFRSASVAALCVAEFALGAAAADAPITYPPTKRIDHVDDYHGVKVPDPYRWLEADVRESKEVADWVEAENKVTVAYLHSSRSARPSRNGSPICGTTRRSRPRRVMGPLCLQQERRPAKPGGLLHARNPRRRAEGAARPEQWSKDGTVALAGMAFSEDGKYLAYGVSEAGSDWSAGRSCTSPRGRSWATKSAG